MRMGYSLTGAKNRPAMPPVSVTKPTSSAASTSEAYFRGYIDPLAQGARAALRQEPALCAAGQLGSGHAELDRRDARASSASGAATIPTPYLPVLAGRVVESAEVSDRFLWDFRRTLADMFADNHYKVATEFLRQRGIGTYAKPRACRSRFPKTRC